MLICGEHVQMRGRHIQVIAEGLHLGPQGNTIILRVLRWRALLCDEHRGQLQEVQHVLMRVNHRTLELPTAPPGRDVGLPV